MQIGLQNSLEEYHKSIQHQLQSMVEQMHDYNMNKSVLGEGLIAPVDRVSSSHNGTAHYQQTETQVHGS